MSQKKRTFEQLVRAEYEAQAKYEFAHREYAKVRAARRQAEDQIEEESNLKWGPLSEDEE